MRTEVTRGPRWYGRPGLTHPPVQLCMEDGYSRQKQKLAPGGAETHERYILLTQGGIEHRPHVNPKLARNA